MSVRLSIRVKAFVVSLWSRLYDFREANHTSIVKAMAALPKYPAPRPCVHPVPAKVLSLEEWILRHAPEHKRSA